MNSKFGHYARWQQYWDIVLPPESRPKGVISKLLEAGLNLVDTPYTCNKMFGLILYFRLLMK
jgi:hypothetical protein